MVGLEVGLPLKEALQTELSTSLLTAGQNSTEAYKVSKLVADPVSPEV